MVMDEYKKAIVLENENEARLLESILTQRGIPFILRSYHDTAFNGLYQTQKGWGHVNAPSVYHEEIKEIIFDLREAAGHKENP
jgi:hypothetical protein